MLNYYPLFIVILYITSHSIGATEPVINAVVGLALRVNNL